MNNINILTTLAATALALLPAGNAAAQTREDVSRMLRQPGLMEQTRLKTEAGEAASQSVQVKSAPERAGVNTADFYGRKFYGALINSTEWTNTAITEVPYGVYSFDLAAAPAMTSHLTYFGYSFTGAAWGYNKLIGVAPMSIMGALNGARYYIINTATMKEEKDVVRGIELKGYGILPAAMAYNPVDNKFYSFQYKSDLSGLDWCVYNTEYDDFDKLAAFRGKYNVLTLAAVPSGDMYFINSYGDLYSVNKETSRPALIGYTGVAPTNYVQSMVYDGRTGLLLWAAQTETGSELYVVDPATAVAQKVLSFKNSEEFAALWPADNAAPDAAPDSVKNLKFEYSTPGSLQGTISFTMPDKTFGGQSLSGSTLNVWLDGKNLRGTEAQAGGKVSIPVDLTEGNHYVAVNLKNDGGWSPTISTVSYAGYDVPDTVSGVKFTHDAEKDKNTVKWTAPKGGINNGYVDFDNLTYSLVRMPDSVTVATGVKDTTFTEATPAAMHNYSYRVFAVNNGKAGGQTESNSLICGQAFTAPYKQLFSDPKVFTDFFTVIDGNNDGNTWRAGYSDDVRIDLNVNSTKGDDWLVTPAIELEGGVNYRLTINLKTFSKGYPEDIEVLIGTNPKDTTTFKSIKKENDFELYEEFSDYSVDFNTDAPGRYYLALRYLSDAAKKGSMMMVKSFAVTKIGSGKAPAAVSDLKVVPAGDDSMTATVSFTAPDKNLGGSDLEAITRINVYRNDGKEPVHTFTSPEKGAQLSFTDKGVTTVGTNTYTVIGENNYGTGGSASASAFVGVYTAPYSESFDTKEAASLYYATSSGYDQSNYTYYGWKYDSNKKLMNANAFNLTADSVVNLRLYTPVIRLAGDAVYDLSFKINNNPYQKTVTSDLWMGTDTTAVSQTVKLADLLSNTNYKLAEQHVNVVPDAAGKYRFCFHGQGTAQYDYINMDLDDIALTYLKPAASPYMFTNYSAVPDKKGNLSVAMSFNAPEVDYKGNHLDGNLKVEIFRGSNPTPVYSREDIVPGAKVTWTDTQAQPGNNVYMLVAQNSYGRSETLTDTVFVGRDVPNTVTELKAKGTADNQKAVLSWDAPTTGVNGGVVLDNELTYNIYSYNPTDGTLTAIEKNVKGTTYTVEREATDNQEIAYYAVSAVTAQGESKAVALQIVLGKLYEMPFAESFAARQLSTNPWQMVTTDSYRLNWGLTNPDGATYNKATAQDNDGGVAYMYNGNQYEVWGGAAFISPKVKLGGENGVLKFWVYNVATGYPSNPPVVQVLVSANDGDYDNLGQITVGSDTELGWKQYEIDLSRYKNEPNLQFVFFGLTDGYKDVIYLDNVTLTKGEPSGIGANGLDNGAASHTETFDLSGRRVISGTTGVTISRKTYSDGTVKTVKKVSLR